MSFLHNEGKITHIPGTNPSFADVQPPSLTDYGLSFAQKAEGASAEKAKASGYGLKDVFAAIFK